jgi:hypothetical protein
MHTSTETDKLDVALTAFQKEVPKVRKKKSAEVTMKSGGKYKYSYADLADVLTTALPVLTKYDLHITQGFVAGNVQTQVHHSSGQWKGDDGIPLPTHLAPQELGSAITFFKRYGVCALLGIAPEGDDVDAAKTGKGEKQVAAQNPKFIAKDVADKLRNLLVEQKKDPAMVRRCLQEFGFMSCAEITKDRYEDVRDALEGV